MNSYEVTIAIPIYNAEKYIRETLDSVMEQTYQDIEILILDDCGYDSSMDIVREYMHTHPRGKDIHIVHQPRNMGIGNARNRILDEANGRYLYFLDADDTISPYTVDLMVREAKTYDAELVYASYQQLTEKKDGGFRCKQYCYPSLKFNQKNAFAHYAYSKYDAIQAPVWNILMSVEMLRKNEIRFEPVNYWEDLAFTIDLPTYVTRVVLLPDVTYSYYCRGGSLSRFQERTIIRKEEIQQTVELINHLKINTKRVKDRSYLPLRTYKVMLTDFYIICNILHERKKIHPGYSDEELRNMMRYPLPFSDIIHFQQARKENLLLHLFGELPPSLSVKLMWLLGKRKGLV